MTVEKEILLVKHEGPVLQVAMNRSERRNALSRSLAAALLDAFSSISESGETRVVVLSGNGPAFCAGGDIQEYKRAAESGASPSDAKTLSDLLASIAGCPVPVVARVHGSVFGGGVGLVSACDIAIAAGNSQFSLSEARLGLVPAVISPYALSALGQREAVAKMLLAAPFGADEALRCGLIHQVAAEGGLDAAIATAIDQLLKGSPGALTLIKRIPQLLAASPSNARDVTTGLLIDRLSSEEGQEGLQAFLDKRPPSWATDRAGDR